MTDSPSNTNIKPSQGDLWREWATKAQNGDKIAYNALLREISPFIRGSLFRSLANADWADEITQEALISVHKSLKTYSADRPFRPWLMAIVNFRRTDYLRTHYGQRRNVTTDLEDAEFQAAHVTNTAHAGEYKDIEAALGALPAKQRRAVELVRIQGLTNLEAGKELNMSESAIKVTVHRALIKLKSILE
jgi:RNA polymerase sigma-70 factor (ECF subfamily)